MRWIIRHENGSYYTDEGEEAVLTDDLSEVMYFESRENAEQVLIELRSDGFTGFYIDDEKSILTHQPRVW